VVTTGAIRRAKPAAVADRYKIRRRSTFTTGTYCGGAVHIE